MGKGDYSQILEAVFHSKYSPGMDEVEFSQEDLRQEANNVGIEIRNFPDLVYNLRSRAPFPASIKKKWVYDN